MVDIWLIYGEYVIDIRIIYGEYIVNIWLIMVDIWLIYGAIDSTVPLFRLKSLHIL